MRQWEYIELSSLEGLKWRVKDTPYQPLIDIANLLGSEGWELVSVHEAGGGLYLKTWRAIFKRPYEAV